MRKSSIGFVLVSLILLAGCDGAPEQQTTVSAGKAFAATAGSTDSLASSAAAVATTPTICGGPGQVCCGTYPNYTCQIGSCRINRRFFPSALCPPCGGSGQACCSGSTCNAGLSCLSEVCQPPCGGNGQACCSGSTCDAGLSCVSSVCQPPCGGSGQACCLGSTCDAGLSCLSDVCQPVCGGGGQACCTGNTCDPGLTCLGTLCHKLKWPR
jgi:hypothetical protein